MKKRVFQISFFGIFKCKEGRSTFESFPKDIKELLEKNEGEGVISPLMSNVMYDKKYKLTISLTEIE